MRNFIRGAFTATLFLAGCATIPTPSTPAAEPQAAPVADLAAPAFDVAAPAAALAAPIYSLEGLGGFNSFECDLDDVVCRGVNDIRGFDFHNPHKHGAGRCTVVKGDDFDSEFEHMSVGRFNAMHGGRRMDVHLRDNHGKDMHECTFTRCFMIGRHDRDDNHRKGHKIHEFDMFFTHCDVR